jgi:hypothetical protein
MARSSRLTPTTASNVASSVFCTGEQGLQETLALLALYRAQRDHGDALPPPEDLH